MQKYYNTCLFLFSFLGWKLNLHKKAWIMGVGRLSPGRFLSFQWNWSLFIWNAYAKFWLTFNTLKIPIVHSKYIPGFRACHLGFVSSPPWKIIVVISYIVGCRVRGRGESEAQSVPEGTGVHPQLGQAVEGGSRTGGWSTKRNPNRLNLFILYVYFIYFI